MFCHNKIINLTFYYLFLVIIKYSLPFLTISLQILILELKNYYICPHLLDSKYFISPQMSFALHFIKIYTWTFVISSDQSAVSCGDWSFTVQASSFVNRACLVMLLSYIARFNVTFYYVAQSSYYAMCNKQSVKCNHTKLSHFALPLVKLSFRQETGCW